MKAWIGVVALVGSLASGSAMADGNELLSRCQATIRAMDTQDQNANGYDMGYCFGVISGSLSLIGVVNSTQPKANQICLPKKELTNGQAARILVKHLIALPEILNLDEGVVALLAIHQAYPCK